MRAQANRLEDKRLLQKLSDALETSYGRIKLDECGDWNIVGKTGHIFTDAKEWYLLYSGTSKRNWNNVKKKLKFMEITQDGDEEGIFKLERMPSSTEAKAIKKILKLRSRVVLSEEDRALLKIRFKSSSQRGVSSSRIDLN